jgi:hypothetical protein
MTYVGTRVRGLWYTFERRGEAETFAKRVHQTDYSLQPKISHR